MCVCVCVCVCRGGGVLEDMKTSKEGAEEVVEGDDKGVSPFFAVVEFERWVLLGALGKWERCVHVCVCIIKYVHQLSVVTTPTPHPQPLTHQTNPSTPSCREEYPPSSRRNPSPHLVSPDDWQRPGTVEGGWSPVGTRSSESHVRDD